MTTLYKFHPETGADAEDIEIPAEATEKDRIEFAEMRRNGATFWWEKSAPGDPEVYHRVERGNRQFVADATGETLTFNTEQK